MPEHPAEGTRSESAVVPPEGQPSARPDSAMLLSETTEPDETVVRIFDSLKEVANGMVARTGRGDLEGGSILLRVMTNWLPQRERWRHRSEEARRYLITCLRNEITNEIRRKRPEALVAERTDDRREPRDDDDRLIRQAIADADLHPKLRALTIMRALEGRSWEEIGRSLEIQPGLAKTTWSRKREEVVKALVALAAGQLGALNHVIARRVLAEGASIEETAAALGLDQSELLDRLECEVIPTLRLRLGGKGLELISEVGRIGRG